MSHTNEDSVEDPPSNGDHTYPIPSGEPASEAVYTATAELTDRSPLELSPLAYTIDPDALDAIVAADGTSSGIRYVSFEYEDYRVTVTTDEVMLEGGTTGTPRDGQ